MNTYTETIKISDYTKKHFKDHTLLKIETTGLSKFTDSVFMVATLKVNTGLLTIKYLSSLKDEFELISSLPTTNLITFNGDFDIAFLKEKFKFYKIDFSVESFSLHKYLKNFNFILNLSSLKQKEIEKYLGLVRPKYISGFKIASSIKKYLISKEEDNICEVLTHAKDSLVYLDKSLKIIEEIESHINFKINEYNFRIEKFNFKNNFLTIQGQTELESELEINSFYHSLKVSEKTFKLQLEIKEGKYSDDELVFYVLNKNGELTNHSNIASPHQVHLLYYKNPIWENILELTKNHLSKLFVI
ncbi:ribonuclease H-like domain-containing protein [Peptoniphilus asaccharolyticus]